jgi:hypothetical protein
MQEIASLELAFNHAAVEAGESCRAHRARIYSLLEARGLSPAPTLVSDLLTAALDGGCVRSPTRANLRGGDVVRCMNEVSQVMTRVLGAPVGRLELRSKAALRFFETWFAGAPKSSCTPSLRPKLELLAIGLEPQASAPTDAWTDWRIAEEAAFRDGGSPAFKRALAEVRISSAARAGEVDDRIWYITGDGGNQPRDLYVAAKRRGGGEGMPIRSPFGVFKEVSPHGIPPDPTRIAPSDLALFSARNGPMRALLASKLADSALMVRFGAMPTPARQRPRVLLVAALLDPIELHIQRDGCVVCDVEVLRECLLHAITACIQTFGRANVDFELEVRRDGAIARGRHQFDDLRSRHGKVRLEYRQADRLRDLLAHRTPWMFVDTISPSYKTNPPQPATTAYDAAYLIAAGNEHSLHGCTWTGAASARPEPDGRCAVTAVGSVAKAPTLLEMNDPTALGRELSECFGEEPGRLERDDPSSEGPEGAVIS